ncbi:glucan phosphoethanolaminetransferase (alkaline phosphatase superfamily) [Paenibacillus sp. V4I3]|uniref:prolipoprotein diacylglyceryl transferase family protein n=1 Tax=Paenibacillus sp. V4I3 TaxID=3042305 RepID=UPI00278ADF39|nr:prolipoprotein diacylglyceryl transferase family protein [Paenibacillus sp. V4I3]MDQ0871736.1 glucan phosphoethanolaminetransferase (alkaline phosphatase superfamily) [Paenibacillus sp. V4I3]
MPDVLQIGPFQLQGRLLALLLACALGLWLIRRVSQRLLNDTQIVIAKPIEDLIFNSAIIVLLTWKLGVIVTQPSLLWNNPLKLLMVSGSGTEIVLGVLIACIYMYYQIDKNRTPLLLVLDVIAIGITASVFLFSALIPAYGLPTTVPWGIGVEGTVSRFHPYHAYISLLLVPLLIWQHVIELRKRTLGQGVLLKYSLFYGGVAGMLASFFDAAKPTLLYLSLAQLLFLFMLIIGMLFPVLTHNTSRKELSAMSQNDSKTQIQQEQQNQEREKTATPAGKEGFVDKKLDGPNRPST